MALTPLDRQVQGSKHRVQPENDRTGYHYGEPVPKTSLRHSSSVPLARNSACKGSTPPDARYEAVTTILSGWTQRFLEEIFPRDYRYKKFDFEFFTKLSGLIISVEVIHIRTAYQFDDLAEFERFCKQLLIDRWLYIPLLSGTGQFGSGEVLYRALRFGWARTCEYKLKVRPFVLHKYHTHPEYIPTLEHTSDEIRLLSKDPTSRKRPLRLRSVRDSEYKAKIGSTLCHKGHTHPEHLPTLKNTSDEVGILSDDPMSGKIVARWKSGPGRKKAWRLTPCLTFANKDETRLLRCSHRRRASFHSCPLPLRGTDLIPSIKHASTCFSVPTAMLEHGKLAQYRSRMYSKPSAVKCFARRLGIPTSHNSSPRTRLKLLPFEADGLIDCNEGDGGASFDVEEDGGHGFELESLDENSEGALLSGIGGADSEAHLPKSGRRGRSSKLIFLTHLILYESFVGSYLGRSFRLQGFVRNESCYDLYAVEPIFQTSQVYEARAYTFQGLKYEERKYRMRHFRRCQGNKFCEESLNQGGKRWVISRCGSKKEEEVLIPSSSTGTSCKKVPVPSCDKGKFSVSPSPTSTTEIPEQLDRVRERTRSHTPNNTGNTIQKPKDGYQAKRSSQLQSQVDSVQIKLERLATLRDVDTLVVAKGSATGSSSSRLAKYQETPILYLPDLKDKVRDTTCGSRKEKSPEQRERRKERRRRAQQVRRMMKSDKQNSEPTPRVFMQWEKSEVRSLLYKQELTLKSAHQAELQKQAATMDKRYQAERQELAAFRTEQHFRKFQEQVEAMNGRYESMLHVLADVWTEKHFRELQEQAATMEERYFRIFQEQVEAMNGRYESMLHVLADDLAEELFGELQEQAATMEERYEAELQKQAALMEERDQQHQEEIDIVMRTGMRIS